MTSFVRFVLTMLFLLTESVAWSCFAGAIGHGRHENDHAQVVADARQIVLATVTKVEKMSNDRMTEYAVFTFSVNEKLKGQLVSEFQLFGIDQTQYPATATDFSLHNEKSFWETKIGRTVLNNTMCELEPTFSLGQMYLVIDGETRDSKDYERIASQEDLWLAFVRRELERNKSTEGEIK